MGKEMFSRPSVPEPIKPDHIHDMHEEDVVQEMPDKQVGGLLVVHTANNEYQFRKTAEESEEKDAEWEVVDAPKEKMIGQRVHLLGPLDDDLKANPVSGQPLVIYPANGGSPTITSKVDRFI